MADLIHDTNINFELRYEDIPNYRFIRKLPLRQIVADSITITRIRNHRVWDIHRRQVPGPNNVNTKVGKK